MTRIPLTRGLTALVDEDDFAAISAHRWFALSNGRPGGKPRFVAARTVKNADGSRSVILMHRAIAAAPNGQEVDHENRDPLDNRRANLRIATRNQNVWNKRSSPNVTGYRGVQPHRLKYRAQIAAFGKIHWSKTFGTAEEAARAYDDLAIHHHGQFAVLNFPTQSQSEAA